MARKKFTIRLNDKEKEKYREYMEEESGAKNLSQWFRDLADKKVDSPADDGTSALDEALLRSIISDETREIKNELSNLTRELADLDEAIRTGDQITSLAEEAYLIFSGNEPKHINEYPRETLNESQEATSPEWLARQSGSPEAFAVYFGTSAEEARRVLVRCENMFPAIESDINEAGKRYWYRADATTRDGMENVGDGV